jgi:cytochrome c-type biogenesis protein CcmH/NrfF
MESNVDEYYELLPVSPIKKLKKELDEIKKAVASSNSTQIQNELMKEIMETVKMNQRVVEDIVKSNAALQTKMSEMIIVMNRLIEEISIMGESFKKAAEALTIEAKNERTEELLTKLLSEMSKLITQNQNILDSLTKLEKQMIQRQLQRAPSPFPVPSHTPSLNRNPLPLNPSPNPIQPKQTNQKSDLMKKLSLNKL